TNNDGTLEASEVASTTFVCAGAQSAVRVVAEPPGANCTFGGEAIEAGTDTNGNGVLDDAEVQTTSFVCAGPGEAQPLVAIATEPPGANCPTGGSAIEVGLDGNGDGILE